MAWQARVGRISGGDSARSLASGETGLATLLQRLLAAKVSRTLVTTVDYGGSSEAICGFQASFVASLSESSERLVQLAKLE